MSSLFWWKKIYESCHWIHSNLSLKIFIAISSVGTATLVWRVRWKVNISSKKNIKNVRMRVFIHLVKWRKVTFEPIYMILQNVPENTKFWVLKKTNFARQNILTQCWHHELVINTLYIHGNMNRNYTWTKKL